MGGALFINLELREVSTKNCGPAECAVRAAQHDTVEEAGGDEQPVQTTKVCRYCGTKWQVGKAFELASGHKFAAERSTTCGIQCRRRSKRGHTDLSVIS